MFVLFFVELKEDIIFYILEIFVIWDGFDDFIVYIKEYYILFYIVSGGIDFFVKLFLGNWVVEEMFYCNGFDFFGEYIFIMWFYICDK